MLIEKISFFTGKKHIRDLDITKEQFNEWMSGVSIQNAFPNLSPDDREFLMTGATKDEWDNAFRNR